MGPLVRTVATEDLDLVPNDLPQEFNVTLLVTFSTPDNTGTSRLPMWLTCTIHPLRNLSWLQRNLLESLVPYATSPSLAFKSTPAIIFKDEQGSILEDIASAVHEVGIKDNSTLHITVLLSQV
jgi:hypothetical protein